MAHPSPSALSCPGCGQPTLTLRPARIECTQCAFGTVLEPDRPVRVTAGLTVRARGPHALTRAGWPGPSSADAGDATVVVIERGRAYHAALRMVASRVVERLNRRTDPDLQKLAVRAAEWLASRRSAPSDLTEPDGARVAEALGAGFRHAALHPIDPEAPVTRWLREDLAAEGIVGRELDTFIRVAESELPGPFALLDEAVAARHVAVVAGATVDEAMDSAFAPSSNARPRCHDVPAATDAVLDLFYELSIVADSEGERIGGWIFGTRPVRKVAVDGAGGRLWAPVGAQRPDVFWEYEGRSDAATDCLVYSGLLATLTEGRAPVLRPRAPVRVLVELEDGRVVVLAEDRKLRRMHAGGFALSLQRFAAS